jgi:hypothetical protein
MVAARGESVGHAREVSTDAWARRIALRQSCIHLRAAVVGRTRTHQLYLHLPRRAQDVDPLVRILWVLVDRHVLLEPLVQRREVYFDEVFELFGAEDEDAFGRLLAGCGLVGDGERAEVYFVACTRDRAVFGEV